VNEIRRTKGIVLGVAIAAVAILLSACGGAGYGSSSAPPTHRVATGTGASVFGTRSIPGIGTVLDDSKGFTLYRLSTDTRSKTTCLGECAQEWPPLLATKGVPRTSPDVNGTFATIRRPDGGTQVTFNGMPLYTFAGDSGPGQANGQGISGFLAVTL